MIEDTANAKKTPHLVTLNTFQISTMKDFIIIHL